MNGKFCVIIYNANSYNSQCKYLQTHLKIVVVLSILQIVFSMSTAADVVADCSSCRLLSFSLGLLVGLLVVCLIGGLAGWLVHRLVC